MCEEKQASADVQETALAELDKNILLILLQDRSTGKNILWATDDYKDLGIGFAADDEITLPAITGAHGNLIKPRALKSKEEQGARTRNMAEVFTPLWICNKQNNLADNAWFGRENVFNTENGTDWQATEGKIAFPSEKGADGWIAYIASKRLEITCGEAPYLASRYDTMTGEIVPLEKRIGLLDRKLRVINERIRNFKDRERAKKRWLELATLAVRSTYGFEWAGDNILLARENLLFTVADYYAAKFGDALDMEMLEHFAEIISWNIWQMDGLKAVVPNSCHDYKKERQAVSPNLFLAKDFSARTLKRSVSPCDVDEDERQKCQGCLKDNIDLHNGVYCKFKNWSTGKVLLFKDMLDGEGSEGVMSKDFKFDVVIGNPPYQVSDGGNGKSAKPVYHFFVNEIRELSPDLISMIIPSRWFAGGKGLDDFRSSMLKDKRIETLVDYENFKDVFPGVDLAGGACFFLWKKKFNGECTVVNATQTTNVKMQRYLDEFDILVRSNKSLEILRKVMEWNKSGKNLSSVVSSRKPFGLPTNYSPLNSGVPCWFIQRIGRKFADCNDVDDSMGYLDKWKLLAPKAPIAGQTDFTKPVGFYYEGNTKIAKPGECCTESFIILGAFNTEKEVLSYRSYIFTKLVRFLLLQTVVSQDVTKKNFVFVPDLGEYNKYYTDDLLRRLWGITDNQWEYVDSKIGYSHEGGNVND